ncbi:PaaI family thioesterase [Tsukamurella sp. NPDC003166]|uniref:PaaI family thioesterase n=1 Tax=Tsukamurella sp. NPDC003166 TaxID=3154444 RepID=UPI0033A072E3
MRYPTAISRTLGFRLIVIGEAEAVLAVDARVDRVGNQQGTVHGGFLTELADAAIGTACSTLMGPGESFTSIGLAATFLRPSWDGGLTATARATHVGRTVSHWSCVITRDTDGKDVMTATSTVMTLRGEQAAGR